MTVYATHLPTGTKIKFKSASDFLTNCVVAAQQFEAMGLPCKAERLGEDFDLVVY